MDIHSWVFLGLKFLGFHKIQSVTCKPQVTLAHKKLYNGERMKYSYHHNNLSTLGDLTSVQPILVLKHAFRALALVLFIKV